MTSLRTSPAVAVLYGIPNCDTVKRSRAWLAEHGVAHEFHDFKKHGVSLEHLQAWAGSVGLERLLNRKGTAWRGLDADTQAQAARPEAAMALMQRVPSLIKRPVVRWAQGQVTVGFDPQVWVQLKG